ncbi:MAG: rhomboid family intramembrane serine protease [Planctomycetes bacterium]|nr:rhomboid family intramembrane serine protease [Planctomycetota bacterium]MCW8134296.1 rhomboid family intramembrane serine protease [Planctomycetota bacterium]
MFPLKTTERVNSWPIVTWLLIAINVFVFSQQLLVTDIDAFFRTYGLVPGNYRHLFTAQAGEDLSSGAKLLPFLSCMFLHGGLWHLLGNMLSLFVFGPNVEDRFGHVRFAVIYLACGLAASITQIPFSAGSEIPVVGASGAIAGVMGGFFVLFPKARVISVVPIIVIPLIVRVPAFFYLLFWIGMNVINALTEIQLSPQGAKSAGVAWWAHIGGFVIGMVYAVTLARKPQAEKKQE